MAGKILIVDDVTTSRIALKVKIAEARYEVYQALSGQEALDVVFRDVPALILINLALSDIRPQALCRRLRALPALSAVPILMIAPTVDPDIRAATLRAGAWDVLPQNITSAELLAHIRAAMRRATTDREHDAAGGALAPLGLNEAAQTFTTPSHIAIVAQRREMAVRWKSALSRNLPYDKLQACTREDALLLTSGPNCPNAFLLTPDMAAQSEGLSLVADLRSRMQSPHYVVCMANGPDRPDLTVSALDLGVDDLMPADISDDNIAAEVGFRLRRQIERKKQLERRRAELAEGLRLATIDALTGLHNRRYAMTTLTRMTENARACGRTPTIMILDIDRFKQVNDTWGHGVGDAVLIEVANRLRTCLGAGDLLARIGGEEFLIATTTNSHNASWEVAEHIRQVMRSPIQSVPPQVAPLRITVSIGMCIGINDTNNVLIERADSALLQSKNNGRNQVNVFSAPQHKPVIYGKHRIGSYAFPK